MSDAVKARSLRRVREWNERVPIGAVVFLGAVELHTWSHAGLGKKDAAVVFVAEREEPVLLTTLRLTRLDSHPRSRARRPGP